MMTNELNPPNTHLQNRWSLNVRISAPNKTCDFDPFFFFLKGGFEPMKLFLF